MQKALSCMFAVALSFGLGASIPAVASPLPAPTSIPSVAAERPMADVHQVQRYHYRGGHHYWRGHRGYRHYRHGYRYHDGYWYPPAAFIAGAIIGGALAAPPPRAHHRSYHYGPAHVEWCYARYRSYRASDNTFQPYNGPRRQCRSPHM